MTGEQSVSVASRCNGVALSKGEGTAIAAAIEAGLKAGFAFDKHAGAEGWHWGRHENNVNISAKVAAHLCRVLRGEAESAEAFEDAATGKRDMNGRPVRRG